jgi:hypothetical protein
MYGADRAEVRDVFFRAWRQHREHRPLEGIEKLIVDVALQHPEYHPILEAPPSQADRDYATLLGESNPFMHMGLHIAIAEQLSIDQPPGIRAYYQQLRARLPDTHAVEHAMMECLNEMLWRATREHRTPDQAAYLDCVKHLAEKT